MEEKSTALERFFTACDDLIDGKHILADKKIGELLRAVATSDDLMGLFAAVTDKFDYQAAKRAYLRTPEQNRSFRCDVLLPADKTQLLAFVFCLLVEFDNGSLKLNDFLLRYFYEDGSLTASYTLFVSKVIRPFRDVVRGCFPNAGKSDAGHFQRKKEEGILEALSYKVAAEQARLAQLPLSREDAIAGGIMLTELSIAVDRKEVPEIKALLCGYLYYLQVIDGTCENSSELILLAGEL